MTEDQRRIVIATFLASAADQIARAEKDPTDWPSFHPEAGRAVLRWLSERLTSGK
jgi:hypothetical protein